MNTAQKIVMITALLWCGLAIFAGAIARMPQLALLPLYGLYPGEVSSGEPGYHPAIMSAWAIATGAVFLTLGIMGAVKGANRPQVRSSFFFFYRLCFLSQDRPTPERTPLSS